MSTDTPTTTHDPLAAPAAVAPDPSREEDCRRIADAAVERFGRLDVLNNAGIGDAAPAPKVVAQRAGVRSFPGRHATTHPTAAELVVDAGSTHA